MKRVGDRGTYALTLLHKLAGLAWVVAAVAVLVLTVPPLASGQVAWSLVAAFGRAGAIASVLTLALALGYGVLTVWGFVGSRWLIVKWALYLLAVAASGYAIRATREESVTTVVLLTAIQLPALVTAIGVGVFLNRSRQAGTLPRGRRSGKGLTSASI